jgi:serine protease Do
MKRRGTCLLSAAIFLLLTPASAVSQDKDAFVRSNPKFRAAFRDVVASASKSTVRVLCDGKDAALGAIVGPDGWILTKAHELKGSITCKLRDGRSFAARLAGKHERHDLALLKIDAAGLTPVLFADSTNTRVAGWLACPGMEADPVAFGVVSVATRDVPNNGGPIMAANPGYLGVALANDDAGVRIKEVMPKTPAEEAGLKVDDLILMLEGKKVSEPQEFIGGMQQCRPGDVITLKIVRNEQEREIKAKLTKKPPSRGDIQNNMGSKLSSRRSGYPTILQFDGVILPTDCGGPVVNLDGRVIGITISRAGRTENWAVPSEVIRPVLMDLMTMQLTAAKSPKEMQATKNSAPKSGK